MPYDNYLDVMYKNSKQTIYNAFSIQIIILLLFLLANIYRLSRLYIFFFPFFFFPC